MSGGGGSTTTQTNDPWSGIQPYLTGQEAIAPTEGRTIIGPDGNEMYIPGTQGQEAITGLYPMAQQLLNQGPQSFYGGQTYAGFNPLQLQSQQGMLNYSNNLSGAISPVMNAQNQLLGGGNALTSTLGQNLGGASGAYQNVLNRTGYGPTWGAMGDTAATQALASQYNQNPLNTQSGQNLMAMQTPQGNPYLDQMVGSAQNKTIESFKQNYLPGILQDAQGSGQGAGDSGYYKALMKGSQGLVDRLGDISTQMYGQAYNADMNRALSAQQAGLGVEQAGASRSLQAAGMGAGMEQAQGQFGVGSQQALDAAQLGAAGNIFNQYGSGLNMSQAGQLQAMGLAPQNFQLGMMPYNIQSQLGAQQQGMDQQAINEAMQRYYYPQQSQQDLINWYSGILSGAGGLGGTSTQTQQNGGNSLAQGAGLGIAAYGAGINPYAAAGIGLVSML